MHVRLIQPRERFGPPERQDELEDCWQRSWGLFDSYQTPSGRPTFNDLFALCEEGAINVIANSDLYFDQTIRYAMPRPEQCYALSRWDVDTTGVPVLWNNHDSQDTFIFNGIPRGIDAPFTQGLAGCDNRLCYLIEQAGYKVRNPSKTIKTYHLHNVPWRSYLLDPSGKARGGDKIDRIPPPYSYAQPCEL